jgi:hypothetical protein
MAILLFSEDVHALPANAPKARLLLPVVVFPSAL